MEGEPAKKGRLLFSRRGSAAALSEESRSTKTEKREEQVSLNLLQQEVEATVRAEIVLETRKAVWRRFSKLTSPADLETRARSSQSLSSRNVDAWDLPISAASLVASGALSGKQVFEFPDFRTDVACDTCSGEGQARCERCGAREPIECFWCAGTGRLRGQAPCEKCDASGTMHCITCRNAGRVQCKTCDSMGGIRMALCCDVRIKQLKLPPRSLREILAAQGPATVATQKPADPEQSGNAGTDASSALRTVITAALFDTVQQLHLAATANSAGDNPGNEKRVPVLARCMVEKYMERTYGATRLATVANDAAEPATDDLLLSAPALGRRSSSSAASSSSNSNSRGARKLFTRRKSSPFTLTVDTTTHQAPPPLPATIKREDYHIFRVANLSGSGSKPRRLEVPDAASIASASPALKLDNGESSKSSGSSTAGSRSARSRSSDTGFGFGLSSTPELTASTSTSGASSPASLSLTHSQFGRSGSSLLNAATPVAPAVKLLAAEEPSSKPSFSLRPLHLVTAQAVAL